MSKTQRRGKVHWTQTPAGRAKLQARSARQRQAKQEVLGSGAHQTGKTIRQLMEEVNDAARLLYSKTHILEERLKTDLT